MKSEKEICGFTRKSEKATHALLARLIEHHDYSVPFQHVTKAQVIEIKAEPERSIPIEIGILPVPQGSLTVDAIKRVVCLHFKITHNEITSPRRDPKIVRPRMVAMYLARDLTNKSYPEIGRAFGNRDHTTVMHAVDKVGKEFMINQDLREQVMRVKQELYH